MSDARLTNERVSWWIPQYPEDRAELVLGGKRYRWSGWYGCQLESSEWWHVPAGAEREIAGRTFRAFSSRRDGLRVRVTWALPSHGTLDEHNARIELLKNDLRRLV
jgi:hypothetical protein